MISGSGRHPLNRSDSRRKLSDEQASSLSIPPSIQPDFFAFIKNTINIVKADHSKQGATLYFYNYKPRFNQENQFYMDVERNIQDQQNFNIIIPKCENPKLATAFILFPLLTLGEGADGYVIKAFNLGDNCIDACKICEHGTNKEDYDHVLRERKNLKMIDARLKGSHQEICGDILIDYTFMKFYPGQNLRAHLYAYPSKKDSPNCPDFSQLPTLKRTLPLLEQAELCIQTVKKLIHIHNRGFYYRDYNVGNLMVNKIDGRIELTPIDFASTMDFKEAADTKSNLTGTPRGYTAPELYTKFNIRLSDELATTEKSDAFQYTEGYFSDLDYYSCGVILLEILTPHNLQLYFSKVAFNKPEDALPIITRHLQKLVKSVSPTSTSSTSSSSAQDLARSENEQCLRKALVELTRRLLSKSRYPDQINAPHCRPSKNELEKVLLVAVEDAYKACTPNPSKESWKDKFHQFIGRRNTGSSIPPGDLSTPGNHYLPIARSAPARTASDSSFKIPQTRDIQSEPSTSRINRVRAESYDDDEDIDVDLSADFNSLGTASYSLSEHALRISSGSSQEHTFNSADSNDDDDNASQIRPLSTSFKQISLKKSG